MKSGTELIAEERERQINDEGWSPEHDDSDGAYRTTCIEQARAAIAKATNG